MPFKIVDEQKRYRWQTDSSHAPANLPIADVITLGNVPYG